MMIGFGSTPKVRVRLFDVADMGPAACLDPEWSIEAFAPYLDFDDHQARVLMIGRELAGVACYRFTRSAFHLHRVVVSRAHQRQGNGRRMVEHLQGMLSGERQNRIECIVHESDLDSQLWLRACRFVCVRLLHGWMYFSFGMPSSASPWRQQNRVQHLIGS